MKRQPPFLHNIFTLWHIKLKPEMQKLLQEKNVAEVVQVVARLLLQKFAHIKYCIRLDRLKVKLIK